MVHQAFPTLSDRPAFPTLSAIRAQLVYGYLKGSAEPSEGAEMEPTTDLFQPCAIDRLSGRFGPIGFEAPSDHHCIRHALDLVASHVHVRLVFLTCRVCPTHPIALPCLPGRGASCPFVGARVCASHFQRKREEILWLSCCPLRGPAAKTIIQPVVFPTVPPGGPQRKREEILWFSYSPPGGPQRKREEILWLSYCPPRGPSAKT